MAAQGNQQRMKEWVAGDWLTVDMSSAPVLDFKVKESTPFAATLSWNGDAFKHLETKHPWMTEYLDPKITLTSASRLKLSIEGTTTIAGVVLHEIHNVDPLTGEHTFENLLPGIEYRLRVSLEGGSDLDFDSDSIVFSTPSLGMLLLFFHASFCSHGIHFVLLCVQIR